MTSRDLQAIERRQQLLDAAKKLFAKNGYYNTSVRSITGSIGMADGLIYHYFPGGKLEMLHTIIKESYEVFSIHVNKILDSINDEMTLREAMLYLCREARSTFELDNEMIIIMVRERELLEKEANELFIKTFAGFWAKIHSFLIQRFKEGEIKKIDFEMATSQFMSTVASTVVASNLTTNIPDYNNQAYIERLVDFTISSWKN